MSDLAIQAAKKLTGKILTGNPNMPSSSKKIMNAFNNMLFRR